MVTSPQPHRTTAWKPECPAQSPGTCHYPLPSSPGSSPPPISQVRPQGPSSQRSTNTARAGAGTWVPQGSGRGGPRLAAVNEVGREEERLLRPMAPLRLAGRGDETLESRGLPPRLTTRRCVSPPARGRHSNGTLRWPSRSRKAERWRSGDSARSLQIQPPHLTKNLRALISGWEPSPRHLPLSLPRAVYFSYFI